MSAGTKIVLPWVWVYFLLRERVTLTRTVGTREWVIEEAATLHTWNQRSVDLQWDNRKMVDSSEKRR